MWVKLRITANTELVAENQVLSNCLSEKSEKLEAGVGKRKLTIKEEQKVIEILGRAGYKVTVLSLKRIKRAGIEISRQGVYGVLARYQESKSKC